MDRDALRAFLERGWTLAERLEREHWAAEQGGLGAAARWRAAAMLYEHMRRVRPDWPSEAERAADLAHHVALKRAIDRAARAFPAR